MRRRCAPGEPRRWRACLQCRRARAATPLARLAAQASTQTPGAAPGWPPPSPDLRTTTARAAPSSRARCAGAASDRVGVPSGPRAGGCRSSRRRSRARTGSQGGAAAPAIARQRRRPSSHPRCEFISLPGARARQLRVSVNYVTGNGRYAGQRPGTRADS
eukprot:1744273-Prymnesium_polylepis.1